MAQLSHSVTDRNLTSNDDPVVEGLGMRPQTPVPLTLEEHRELAAEMKAVNARLQQLCRLVVSVYGPNTQAAFSFRKAAEDVDRLCQDLQAQAVRDLPGYPVDGLYF
ncbi:MAG TPA: hypothetical protein VHW09_13815 [Bryobacteraceae bacterium]|jgi:hypothetical protein|nr:hypothetical protein [Bryobacteraceae bacterium]